MNSNARLRRTDGEAEAASLDLVLSIDVEEEGLFRGSYGRTAPSVRNVAQLPRLSALLDGCEDRLGTELPLNLLCTHSVYADARACRHLDALRARRRVEFGAHLHHWNTPPADPQSAPEEKDAYQSPGSVPDDLLRARLASLFTAGTVFCGTRPTSFRMGRWDLHRRHWPLLAEAGVRVDASVRPLHFSPQGPDHFFAPPDPYRVDVDGAELTEVPLTCVPLLPALAEKNTFCAPPRRKADPVRACAASSVKKWGALAILPAYHPLWAMLAISRLHLARGGRVISLTWHSSEMMPGATPHLPDEAAVNAFLKKIGGYLNRLADLRSLRGRTFAELRTARFPAPLKESGAHDGDWRY